MIKRGFTDQQRDVQRALQGLKTQFSDLREAKNMRELGRQEIAPKRTIVNRTDPAELEGAVMKEVGHLLAVHPRVLFAARINSGGAWLPGKNGKDAPVFFYRIVRSREKMRIPDFIGILTDGRPFAIDPKRRDWKLNLKDIKEAEQWAYILMVIKAGGVGGFVTSGQQAQAILERA